MKTKKQEEEVKNEAPFNPLRNERVVVRYIAKTRGIWGSNPKHILAGGLAEGCVRVFEVPRTSTGSFASILTHKEQDFFEELFGLEDNAMSVHKQGDDNFWVNTNSAGISSVRLTKEDNFLDLSNPEQYIKYKILLAYPNVVASSLQALEDSPMPSYQFVLINEGDEAKKANKSMSAIMEAYKEFGKIEDDADTLRVVIQTLSGKPVSKDVEFLKAECNKYIQANSKLFLSIVKDELLPTKVLIRKAMDKALISNRGGMLYLKSDGTPLCEDNEEPTMNVAAKFLNKPIHQEIKFALEAKVAQ